MTSKKQYGFYIDTTRCTGCKTCMVACKDRSDLEVGINWRRVYEYGGGTYTENSDGSLEHSVFAYFASISCNHCSEPACTKACPTGAMHKRASDGFVHVDQSICIGCESCSRACPYDAPQIDASRKVMTKCDGCFDRVKEGLLPSCVDSCPMRAMDFGLIDELRAKYGDNADILPLPSSNITSPNLVVKTNRLEQSGGTILNPNEL